MMTLGSLWRHSTSYTSPFRVLRCYGLRAVHPANTLRRRILARKSTAALSAEQNQRKDIMEREGCVPANPDTDQHLIKQLCANLQERAKGVQIDMEAKPGKNYWERMLTDDDKKSDSLIVRCALQPAVINMAAAYLGEVPYLAGISVYLSHGTHNTTWQASQLWHCDYDDRRMFKLFVYCTDVKGGPDGEFTYIPKDLSKNVKNNFFPARISDESMDKQGYSKHAKHITGPAGTAFYIDTRGCYHLGSRVDIGHTRIAYIVTYVTAASLQPFNNGIKIQHALTETEQLVLRSGMHSEVVHQGNALAMNQGGPAM